MAEGGVLAVRGAALVRTNPNIVTQRSGRARETEATSVGPAHRTSDFIRVKVVFARFVTELGGGRVA